MGRDGLIRRVWIKYFNSGEKNPRLTDRSVRRLVKLWSIDEACLFDDVSEVQKRLDQDGGEADISQTVGCCDADMAALNSGYSSNTIVLGYYSLSNASRQAGPKYWTTDEVKLDLASISRSCEVTPLLAQQVDGGHGAPLHQEQDEDQQEVDTTSLYSILTSTGFGLE